MASPQKYTKRTKLTQLQPPRIKEESVRKSSPPAACALDLSQPTDDERRKKSLASIKTPKTKTLRVSTSKPNMKPKLASSSEADISPSEMNSPSSQFISSAIPTRAVSGGGKKAAKGILNTCNSPENREM